MLRELFAKQILIQVYIIAESCKKTLHFVQKISHAGHAREQETP